MAFGKLRGSGHWPSLVAAVVYFDFSFMVWVLIGALGAYIAAGLSLSPFQKGLVVAIPVLGGSIFRLVLGSIADRIGYRRAGICAASATLLPLGWGWLAGQSFVQIVAIAFLLGIAGASFAVAIPLVSRWYPPESQGIALGIAGAGNSGTAISALLAPRLAEAVGWHAVFGLAMLPIGLAVVLLLTLAKEPPRTRSKSGLLASLKMLKESDARWLCSFYAVTFGGFVGFVAYLPIYLVDSYSISKVTAGTLAAACGLAGSLVRPIGGWAADRLGGATLLVFAYGVASVLTFVMATSPALPVGVVIFGLMLACLGIGNGAVFQLVPQRFGKSIGAAAGLTGAAGGLGGFFLPLLLGSARALTGGYSPAFATWAIICFGAAGLVANRRRTWVREWQVEVAL